MHPCTDAKGDRIGEHWVPVEIDSLLQSDAPSFPLHQHRFAREMHHFILRCRRHDKLDPHQLRHEYLETLHRGATKNGFAPASTANSASMSLDLEILFFLSHVSRESAASASTRESHR
jgi:hypothetical protein